MTQKKIIRSHGARRKAADTYIKTQKVGERINLIDREAFIEAYLLDDIVNLYKIRLAKEVAKKPSTDAGKMSQERTIKKFQSLIHLFTSAAEVASDLLDNGCYTPVWRAIHEHALMSAANNLKYIDKLKDFAIDLLTILSDDANKAGLCDKSLAQALQELENHEANVQLVNEMFSGVATGDPVQVAAVAIAEANAAFNSAASAKGNKPIPNS